MVLVILAEQHRFTETCRHMCTHKMIFELGSSLSPCFTCNLYRFTDLLRFSLQSFHPKIWCQDCRPALFSSLLSLLARRRSLRDSRFTGHAHFDHTVSVDAFFLLCAACAPRIQSIYGATPVRCTVVMGVSRHHRWRVRWYRYSTQST